MMDTFRKVIKIFIGSPGDLNEERTLFRRIVNEVNRIKSNSMGIQLEPVSWEDTLPGKGRPQELINKDIEQSDLVVMLLWKRWGTPTGNYTSGFEEEYELAKSLNENTNGKPAIWLYFRAIPDDMLADPGEQLKKVIDFRNRIEKERKFLFYAYESLDKWEQLFREHLCRWIDTIKIVQDKLDREDTIPLGIPSDDIQVKNPVVFLSYIHKDEQIVNRLKKDLTERGIRIWIDKEKIWPGDRWKQKINEAIISCEFAIICLSQKALSKEGYFQKELKEINERAEFLPRTRTFRIPVRLDDCAIPDELKEIHVIDLFKDWESGVKGITKSIVANSSNVSLQQQMMEIPKVEIPVEYLKGITQTLLNEAIEKAESGQITKAEEYFAIATVVPTDISALNLYGLFLQRIGMLKKAEEKFKQIEDLSQKIGDMIWVAVATGNLGILYKTRGDLKAAEEMYKKSLAINEELGRKEGMANDYGNLGILYETRGDLKAAEEMYKKSLAINEELGRKEGMASDYGNLGILYKT
ncbi:MAG: TIR domain-containing protein, partial [Candidatus Methanofastidiosa archaeon]|nr:TIR domain-containing protein [Candidatus Methanofastidiosa archaeon]